MMRKRGLGVLVIRKVRRKSNDDAETDASTLVHYYNNIDNSYLFVVSILKFFLKWFVYNI